MAWRQTLTLAFTTPTVYAQIYRQLGASDQTLMTAPDQLTSQGLGLDAYIKPGVGLTVLRNAVLGPDRS